MEVELLYVAGCPNVSVARQRLAEAARRANVEISVREREVGDEDEASAAGMRGSPTILVDARDVGGTGEGPASLSCRLYATENGFAGAPTVEELVEAIQAAAGERRSGGG